MTDLRAFHADHGAVFEDHAGREQVTQYRRPDRTHRAVRSGVGATENPYGVIVVEGADRVEYVDNIVSNRVPATDGRGTYALVLDPQGRIQTDAYVYTGDERVLVFTPPGRARPTVDGWEVFIQDVEITVASDRFATFGVHGPTATEKIASVLDGAPAPDERLSFVRGAVGDAGVTAIRVDDPTGEEGYEVVCAADDAVPVFDALLNRGPAAVPFGRRIWEALTLEAGTPLYATELAGRIPNVAGVRNAIDFGKGCFVGQEIVSKVENRGQPSNRVVGLRPEALPEPGATVHDGDRRVGEITRAVESPVLEAPIAMAVVAFDTPPDADLTVRAAGGDVPATLAALPFVDGSGRSARLPSYDA